jgi:hypothetical protein
LPPRERLPVSLEHLSILVQLMHKDHHTAEGDGGDHSEWHGIALSILILRDSAHPEKGLKSLVLFCRYIGATGSFESSGVEQWRKFSFPRQS